MVKLECKISIVLILSIMVFTTLFSCVAPEKHQDDLYKIGSIDSATKNSSTQYKYIINIDPRSYKVHTYECGDSRIKNKSHQLATNSNLVDILKNKKYDVCHICYAGLRKYKSITEEDCMLIEKYMRIYEFLQNDMDTCEFLMSIFEVGDWYVNNVYTYQGGLNTVSKINSDSKLNASINSPNKWEQYKASYSELMRIKSRADLDNKKILTTVHTNDKPQKYALYKCNLFENRYARGDIADNKKYKKKLVNADGEYLGDDWKNYYVSDDCSKFAAAVYYNYINKTLLKNKSIDSKDGYGINLWYTGSYDFKEYESDIYQILKKTERFDFYNVDKIKVYDAKCKNNEKIDKFKLEVGDLIYRKEKAHYGEIDGKKVIITDIPGHVEFYIGNDKVVGWGEIHKENVITKELYKDEENYCFYSKDIKRDKEQPFTNIIRLRRYEND